MHFALLLKNNLIPDLLDRFLRDNDLMQFSPFLNLLVRFLRDNDLMQFNHLLNLLVRFLRDNDLMHETFDDVVEPSGGCAIC